MSGSLVKEERCFPDFYNISFCWAFKPRSVLSTQWKLVTFANRNKVSKILNFLHQDNFHTLMLSV